MREIFAVTDNREKFLTAKISRYTVLHHFHVWLLCIQSSGKDRKLLLFFCVGKYCFRNTSINTCSCPFHIYMYIQYSLVISSDPFLQWNSPSQILQWGGASQDRERQSKCSEFPLLPGHITSGQWIIPEWTSQGNQKLWWMGGHTGLPKKIDFICCV